MVKEKKGIEILIIFEAKCFASSLSQMFKFQH